MDADFFLNTEKKSSVFENSRLRKDGQIRSKNAACGRRFFKNGGKNFGFRKYPATCGRCQRHLHWLCFMDCQHWYSVSIQLNEPKIRCGSMTHVLAFSMPFSPYVHCQLQLFLNRDFRFVYLFTTVVTSTVDTVTGMLVVIYPLR